MTLFTDLYELTMAQAYWQAGVTRPARFSMFVRRMPAERGYLVFAGLDDMLAALESLGFSPDEIGYLRSLNLFREDFLDWLAQLRFSGGVRAMREATQFFPNEPVLEVSAPVIEAQLAETLLLNLFNTQTMLATKAARVVGAADGRQMVDFAARRTHGEDAALAFARSAYIAGFAGTSNVLAGRRYGLPVFGTMAHSFITSFELEQDAFEAYARAFPDSSTFLVDTYDTLDGVRNAIAVAKRMADGGHALRAARLDSGDLLALSRQARAMLDAADLPGVQVFASGGLDEYEVQRLVSEGAPIDGFGVGTMVGASADYPWLDCVYKQVEYDGRPALKLSQDKQTLPGAKQVWRRYDGAGMYAGDAIARADESGPEGAEPLLSDVMRRGERLSPAGSPADLAALRRRCARELARLPAQYKRLRSPAPYPVSVTPDLQALAARAEADARGRIGR